MSESQIFCEAFFSEQFLYAIANAFKVDNNLLAFFIVAIACSCLGTCANSTQGEVVLNSRAESGDF